MRKFKNLVAMGAAALVLSAVAATPALALPDFHSEVETTWLLGTQHVRSVFDTTAGTVKCGVGAVEATVTQEITGTKITASNYTKDELSLSPSCIGVTAFGQNATVNFNGCTYELNTPTTKTLGDMWIKCPAGKNIVVSVPIANCSLEITGQGSTASPIPGSIDYSALETGSKRDLTLTWTLGTGGGNGVTYTVLGPGTICGTAGAHSDGLLTGATTLKGFGNEGETAQVGIWIE